MSLLSENAGKQRQEEEEKKSFGHWGEVAGTLFTLSEWLSAPPTHTHQRGAMPLGNSWGILSVHIRRPIFRVYWEKNHSQEGRYRPTKFGKYWERCARWPAPLPQRSRCLCGPMGRLSLSLSPFNTKPSSSSKCSLQSSILPLPNIRSWHF